MIELKGELIDLIYYNDENGYFVGALQTENDEVTIVGHMHSPKEGQNFVLQGDWKIHHTYGDQFQFKSYKQVVPTTKLGIESYLASGAVKGIGPKTAKNIVNHFGETTLEVMQYEPEKLLEIDGIGAAKAKTIIAAFKEQRDLMEVMMYLQNYGVTPNYAFKIYKKYKETTISVIQENPYCLADDIFGIGFKTADLIAKKIGIENESAYRIKSGIKFMLSKYTLEGNTYMPCEYFTEKTAEMLDVSLENISYALRDLAIDNQVQLEHIDGRDVVFSMPLFYAETNVCKNLLKLASADLDEISEDVDRLISVVEEDEDIKLANKQRVAVKEALNSGVFVMTGGPGTGKTTTINAIIKIFDQAGKKVALAAPTGRAAKRMSEASNREAKTIHRLLEYAYTDKVNAMNFLKNEEEPLDFDVIIIDEMSMVDILLMNALLKAIVSGTRLILVGDSDQLPSVGAGNVLRDIISSEVINTVKLDEIFRQAQESMIVVNAHRINKGELPYLNEKEKDFYFMNKQNQNDIVKTIKELCLKRLPDFVGCDSLKGIQVLTPMRKGLLGIYNLNNELQSILNPKSPEKMEKEFGNKVFREGDKVMQIKNNYHLSWKNNVDDTEGLGVFNGDFGYVSRINHDTSHIIVEFEDGKVVSYDFNKIEELELSYAVTIHKSQGSEFSVVVMPIFWGPPMLLTRNLLYTAVTRAKKLVVMVGFEKYLEAMVNNHQIVKRNSGLESRLKRILEF